MAELDFEQRFSELESRIAELERMRAIQEDRDIALLARIDGFIDDLRRIERVQMRAFDAQSAQLKDIESDVKTINEVVAALVEATHSHKQAIETLGGILLDHKTTVELLIIGEGKTRDTVDSLKEQVAMLAAGQQQIITLLTGSKSPRND